MASCMGWLNKMLKPPSSLCNTILADTKDKALELAKWEELEVETKIEMEQEQEKAKMEEVEMKNINKVAKPNKQTKQESGIETKIELAKMEEEMKKKKLAIKTKVELGEMEDINKIFETKTQEQEQKQEMITKAKTQEEQDIETKIKLGNYQKAKDKLLQHIQGRRKQFDNIKKKIEGPQQQSNGSELMTELASLEMNMEAINKTLKTAEDTGFSRPRSSWGRCRRRSRKGSPRPRLKRSRRGRS